MDEDSTTPTDDLTPAGSTDEDKATGTDEQTPPGDNLDTSKSDDDSADGDKPTGDEGTDAPAQFDDDLDEWAEKTGRRAPEDDKDRADLQAIRDGQRAYSRSKAVKESREEMDKALKDAAPDPTADDDDDDDDPVAKEVKQLTEKFERSEATRLRSEYFVAKEVTAEEGKAMAAILKEKVDRATAQSTRNGAEAFKFWSDPAQLEDLHDLAQAKLSRSKPSDEIEAEAVRKERERIAKETNSTTPGRGASRTKTSEKTEDEARLERFSTW